MALRSPALPPTSSLLHPPQFRRSARGLLSVLLVVAGATLGCFFHQGTIHVKPPKAANAGVPARLSDDAVSVILRAVEEVATEEGLRGKRGFSKPFLAKLLASYASPEQISVSVWLNRGARSLNIRIRDVNHTVETSYTRSIRTRIETTIRSELPEHRLSYGTMRGG